MRQKSLTARLETSFPGIIGTKLRLGPRRGIRSAVNGPRRMDVHNSLDGEPAVSAPRPPPSWV